MDAPPVEAVIIMAAVAVIILVAVGLIYAAISLFVHLWKVKTEDIDRSRRWQVDYQFRMMDDQPHMTDLQIRRVRESLGTGFMSSEVVEAFRRFGVGLPPRFDETAATLLADPPAEPKPVKWTAELFAKVMASETGRGLYRRCVEDPSAKVIFADWMDENGEGEMAAQLRGDKGTLI